MTYYGPSVDEPSTPSVLKIKRGIAFAPEVYEAIEEAARVRGSTFSAVVERAARALVLGVADGAVSNEKAGERGKRSPATNDHGRSR